MVPRRLGEGAGRPAAGGAGLGLGIGGGFLCSGVTGVTGMTGVTEDPCPQLSLCDSAASATTAGILADCREMVGDCTLSFSLRPMGGME